MSGLGRRRRTQLAALATAAGVVALFLLMRETSTTTTADGPRLPQNTLDDDNGDDATTTATRTVDRPVPLLYLDAARKVYGDEGCAAADRLRAERLRGDLILGSVITTQCGPPEMATVVSYGEMKLHDVVVESGSDDAKHIDYVEEQVTGASYWTVFDHFVEERDKRKKKLEAQRKYHKHIEPVKFPLLGQGTNAIAAAFLSKSSNDVRDDSVRLRGRDTTHSPSTSSPSLTLRTGPSAMAPIPPGASRIQCGYLDPTIPERYCTTTSLAIRFDKLVSRSRGTLDVTCGLNETSWFEGDLFGGGAAALLFETVDFAGGVTAARVAAAAGKNKATASETQQLKEIQCDGWIDTPLFFVSRSNPDCPYDSHQDLFNAFAVYSALALDPSDVQPVILDPRDPDGLSTPLWTTFSTTNRVLDARHLASLLKTRASGTLCVKTAHWGLDGASSALSLVDGDNTSDCFDTAGALIAAFRAFMLDRIRSMTSRTPILDLEPIRKWGSVNGDDVFDGLALPTGFRVKERVRGAPPADVVVTFAITALTTDDDTDDDDLKKKRSSPLLRTTFDGLSDTMFSMRSTSKKQLRNPHQQDWIDALRKAITSASTDKKHRRGSGNASSSKKHKHLRSAIVSLNTMRLDSLPIDFQIAVATHTDVLITFAKDPIAVHALYLRREPLSALVSVRAREDEAIGRFAVCAAGCVHRVIDGGKGYRGFVDGVEGILDAVEEVLKARRAAADAANHA